MEIATGTKLGPYEITGSVGTGGMGEVYKANDTRLDRAVAVKVLPEHFSKDPARRERFEREARAVSSLNHPHICTLHDIGEHDGIHYLVMEHIEGETLSDRLKKGALPLDRALDYGAQIADALDKAHRAGIVHRDLKPGNIMLAKAGVKLLDFGLAKTREEPLAPTGDSEQPTQNKPLTDAGTILGTVQYMAPEQLEGKEVDGRADLFSLGAVLYEMLTGRKAFEGSSQASLISAIMSTEPPPVSELQTLSPPALDRVVKRCLAKDPDVRWQSALDLREELGWVAKSSGTEAPLRGPARARRRSLIWVWALAGLLGFLVFLTGYVVGTRPTPRPIRRVSINVPAKDGNPIAISPDGTLLAYTASHEGVRKLHLRSLGQRGAMPIDGTENALHPFFSPDGQSIGYFAGSTLQKVSISGGAPTRILDVVDARGGDWLTDDTIVYGSVGLWRVPAVGGTPERLTSLDQGRGENFHREPRVLPSGRGILFTNSYGAIEEVAVASVENGETRVLTDGSGPLFSPTGHVVFWRAGSLWAAPFDTERLAFTGAPVSVLANVAQRQYALADDGTLIYASGGRNALLWVQRSGEASPLLEGAEGVHVRLSPSGDRLVAIDPPDLWAYDLERDTRVRLTFDSSNNGPTWTPDGERVTFASTRSGRNSIYWTSIDGGPPELLLTDDARYVTPMSWSPDSRTLAFESWDPFSTGSRDIELLSMNGERTRKKFAATRHDERAASFSPDGRWIAYVSDESGRKEVYVQPYEGSIPKWIVSSGGGAAPAWAKNGSELFYARGQQLWAVPIVTEPQFRAGIPRLLFEGPYDLGPWHAHYDVAADGRFAVTMVDTGTPTFEVIFNWLDELERLAPGGV